MIKITAILLFASSTLQVFSQKTSSDTLCVETFVYQERLSYSETVYIIESGNDSSKFYFKITLNERLLKEGMVTLSKEQHSLVDSFANDLLCGTLKSNFIPFAAGSIINYRLKNAYQEYNLKTRNFFYSLCKQFGISDP